MEDREQSAEEVRLKLVNSLMRHFYEENKESLSRKEFTDMLMKSGIIRHMADVQKKAGEEKN